MDPVSVFNALYDTKCITFAPETSAELKEVPYAVNLRRLSLYPRLVDSIVSQVVDKFLTARALAANAHPKQLVSQKGEPVIPRVELDDEESRAALNKLPPSVASDDSSSNADSHFDEDIETSSNDDNPADWDHDGMEPVLCGPPHSAVSLAATIAFEAQLPYIVSSQINAASIADTLSTEVGVNQKLRPTCESGNQKRRVILVEDVLGSGDSLLEVIKRVESEQQFKIELVICIVDRDENGLHKLEQAGIRVLSLYNMGAILRILETTGRISSRQFAQARSWMAKVQAQNKVIAKPATASSSIVSATELPQTLQVTAS